MKLLNLISIALFFHCTTLSAQVEEFRKQLDNCQKDLKKSEDNANRYQKLADLRARDLFNCKNELTTAQTKFSALETTATASSTSTNFVDLARILSEHLAIQSKLNDTIFELSGINRDLKRDLLDIERLGEKRSLDSAILVKQKDEAQVKAYVLEQELTQLRTIVVQLKKDSANLNLRVDTLTVNKKLLQDTFNQLDPKANYSFDPVSKAVCFDGSFYALKTPLFSIPYTVLSKEDKPKLPIEKGTLFYAQLNRIAQLYLKHSDVLKIRISVLGNASSKHKQGIFAIIVNPMLSEMGLSAKLDEVFDRDNDNERLNVVQIMLVKK